MLGFGHYILRGRWQAAGLAFLFAFLPLLGWLSVIITALVTLRKGAREGLWVMMWAALPALAMAIAGAHWLAVFSSVVTVGMTWLLAVVLRYTMSWRQVLLVATGIGALAIIATHVAKPDIAHYWYSNVQQTFVQMLDKAKVSGASANEIAELEQVVALAQSNDFLQSFAKMLTGFVVSTVLFSILINLGLARWWQAILFNPGGLRQEVYAIKFGFMLPALSVLVAAMAAYGVGMAPDLTVVLVLLLMLVGLVVIHAFSQLWQWGWAFLILFYLILIVGSPYSLVAVACFAVLDCCLDFRKRYQVLERIEKRYQQSLGVVENELDKDR